MTNKIEIKLKAAEIQALLEGSRLEHNYYDGKGVVTQVVIYPDRYGVFMTHEKAADLRRKIQMETYFEILELFESNKKDI